MVRREKISFPGIQTLTTTLIYLAINSLFVYKYGIRQSYIDVRFLMAIYLITGALLIIVSSKVSFSNRQLNFLFFFIAALFFFFSVGLNLLVDGNELNVDRWSALDVAVSALLDGKYPYTAVDHLGGRSSHLPTLIILGIPFHLIGDVGLLQPVIFLFFVFSLTRVIENHRARLTGLLLLILSASYLWEIYVKSDMLGNFIIVMGFICLWYKKYGNKELHRPVLLGALTGLLLLTRLIAFIPLAIFLFGGFRRSSIRTKTIYIGSASVTTMLLLLLVFKDCAGYDILKEYNPFMLQTSQLPLIVGAATLIIPLLFSSKAKSLSGILRLIILLLGLPIAIAFGISLFRFGFSSIIYNSSFDISYFNILMPFIVLNLALEFEVWHNNKVDSNLPTDNQQ